MYVLRTVAGEPVPAALIDNEYATILTLADTLWLEVDGTGVEVATERSTDKGSGTTTVVRTDARPFSHGLAGDRIEVSFECNDVIVQSCGTTTLPGNTDRRASHPGQRAVLPDAPCVRPGCAMIPGELQVRLLSSSTSIPPTRPATKL